MANKANIEEAKQEIKREYIEKIAETLRNMSEDDARDIIADVAGIEASDDLNKVFDGNYYDAIKFGQDNPDFDADASWFVDDGWGGLEAYDDLEDIKDFDELAEQIIDDDDDGGNYDIEELLDAYKEALEAIEEEEEEDDTEARERGRARAKEINDLANMAIIKALQTAQGVDSVDNAVISEEVTRVKLALLELFEAVQERGHTDPDDATREEITSQFIKEEV